MIGPAVKLMKRERTAAAVFFAVFAALAAVLLPGLGYRALWQDEVETAERARSVLDSGVPKVFDPFGEPSLNAGGREIEDGDLHRYTPWLAPYLAAAGLNVGRALGLSRDASVRLPFALSHAAAASLLSVGLVFSAAVPPLPAAALGLVYGLGSVRLLHDRTARYHALLELLAVLGLLSLGALREGRRWARWNLAVVLFLLPHAHSIGGLVLAAPLLAWAWVLGGPRGAKPAAVALAVSFAALVLLSRPWAYSWGGWRVPEFRGLRDLQGVAFPLLAWWWTARRARRSTTTGAETMFGLAAALALLCVFECHDQSQPRYYLALAAPAFFWPLALGLDGLSAAQRRGHWKEVGVLLLAAEALIGPIPSPQRDKTLRHSHPPLQGLRLLIDDAVKTRAGAISPLREALALAAADPAQGAVLVDYVPQFVNWYLPGRKVALMPDRTQRTERNAGHPVWSRRLEWPQWHLWHPRYGSGVWTCKPDCDFKAEGLDLARGRYMLTSRALERREEMCVVRGWMTHHWNNAPFMNLKADALRPGGEAHGPLILARPCRVTIHPLGLRKSSGPEDDGRRGPRRWPRDPS